jgi:hypothetical protein
LSIHQTLFTELNGFSLLISISDIIMRSPTSVEMYDNTRRLPETPNEIPQFIQILAAMLLNTVGNGHTISWNEGC